MNKAGTILSEQTALDLLFALPFAAFESASSAVVLALQYLQSNPLALVELTVINETIRLGNIVPAIFRKVVKDIEIKGSGVRLCAGAEFVKLQISIFLHHLVTNYR
ncbi:hypothetical protein J1N35_027799 [Gossypium stocksii]|uniref:Uncharacterized protein n=1 Tax=Gossypium stocksii TaxID=47602 RepID=A0A9D3VC83_9ROSI|nr:hypothetical protein J1N35_027799 [Gossypium stocksii]